MIGATEVSGRKARKGMSEQCGQWQVGAFCWQGQTEVPLFPWKLRASWALLGTWLCEASKHINMRSLHEQVWEKKTIPNLKSREERDHQLCEATACVLVIRGFSLQNAPPPHLPRRVPQPAGLSRMPLRELVDSLVLPHGGHAAMERLLKPHGRQWGHASSQPHLSPVVSLLLSGNRLSHFACLE